MLGKIIDGRLQFAGRIIKEGNTTITNPTEKKLKELGYKEIQYTEKPTYDIDTQKLQELYTETNIITVSYEIVELTQEEKRQVLLNKVYNLEIQYNMCRWQRELILAENSGASDYTKQKAQEIEDLAKELR